MNKTEQIAYQWLIKDIGYKPEDVIFQRAKTPDFICKDGKGFEVKKAYGRTVWTYRSQFEKLLQQPKTSLLVFKTGESKPTAIIATSDLPKTMKSGFIHGLKIVINDDMPTIRVSDQTKKLFDDWQIKLMNQRMQRTDQDTALEVLLRNREALSERVTELEAQLKEKQEKVKP